ncbi:hypothetical protein HII36_42720 [Nonomuraea sp. NN258]|uniref:hypothetical protein n=1 Tax=Nonomuraea antri TaxID=2730852 RepID=UPI00156891F4|nr:hypothetical protein [Nonomuraea antri]NRQ38496.1 hypothetical protein [Nonomuraea antri]
MPRLLERILDRITIRAFSFMVMDLDGANGQPEGAEDLWDLANRASMTDWFLTTANVAIITSQADSWHTVDVTLELWDGRPLADDAQWARTETAQIYSSSGKLQVVGTEGHSSGNVLDLRGRACHWSVSAGVRPGSSARYHEERPPEGLETYRVQFWPADL